MNCDDKHMVCVNDGECVEMPTIEKIGAMEIEMNESNDE